MAAMTGFGRVPHRGQHVGEPGAFRLPNSVMSAPAMKVRRRSRTIAFTSGSAIAPHAIRECARTAALSAFTGGC